MGTRLMTLLEAEELADRVDDPEVAHCIHYLVDYIRWTEQDMRKTIDDLIQLRQ